MPAILLIQAVDNPPTADDRLRYLAGDVLAVKYPDEPIGDAERNNPAIRIVKVDADPIDLMHLLEDPTVTDEKTATCRRSRKLDLVSLGAAKVEVAKTDAKLGAFTELTAAQMLAHEKAAAVVDGGKRSVSRGMKTRGSR